MRAWGPEPAEEAGGGLPVTFDLGGGHGRESRPSFTQGPVGSACLLGLALDAHADVGSPARETHWGTGLPAGRWSYRPSSYHSAWCDFHEC